MLRTPASTWRNGSSRFDDGHAGPEAAVFQSRQTPWLSFIIRHGPAPIEAIRHAAVRECRHDGSGIRRYSAAAALPRMGHAMLRSLNVSLATPLAFLGSLILLGR